MLEEELGELIEDAIRPHFEMISFLRIKLSMINESGTRDREWDSLVESVSLDEPLAERYIRGFAQRRSLLRCLLTGPEKDRGAHFFCFQRHSEWNAAGTGFISLD